MVSGTLSSTCSVLKCFSVDKCLTYLKVQKPCEFYCLPFILVRKLVNLIHNKFQKYRLFDVHVLYTRNFHFGVLNDTR